MALTFNTTASANYITANPFTSNTANTYAFTAEADVVDNRLTSPNRVTNPGVFTAGTSPEGTLVHPDNDSNS